VEHAKSGKGFRQTSQDIPEPMELAVGVESAVSDVILIDANFKTGWHACLSRSEA